jgi:deazaflavin-dependent oxidoreductase (nitroreductase family)
MKGPIQSALRSLTRATRPLAMRTAGKVGSNTSVIRHIGRRTGRTYETPIVAVEHDDGFLIALPYGERTDWMKNVLATGMAAIVTHGQTCEVDQPRIVPMSEATAHFQPKEQKLHRRFGVDSCLRVHRLASS